MAKSFRPHIYNGGKQQQNQERPAYRKLYDKRWNEYSRWFRMMHPFCETCGAPAYGSPEQENGRKESLGVVDHIIPHRGDVKLFWDERNHQSLCTECHNKKSARERGPIG